MRSVFRALESQSWVFEVYRVLRSRWQVGCKEHGMSGLGGVGEKGRVVTDGEEIPGQGPGRQWGS